MSPAGLRPWGEHETDCEYCISVHLVTGIVNEPLLPLVSTKVRRLATRSSEQGVAGLSKSSTIRGPIIGRGDIGVLPTGWRIEADYGCKADVEVLTQSHRGRAVSEERISPLVWAMGRVMWL